MRGQLIICTSEYIVEQEMIPIETFFFSCSFMNAKISGCNISFVIIVGDFAVRNDERLGYNGAQSIINKGD